MCAHGAGNNDRDNDSDKDKETIMGMFQGLGGARTLGQGNFFPPGIFICEIKEVRTQASSNPQTRGRPQVFVDFNVHGVQMSDADHAWIKEHNGPHPLQAGGTATYFIDVGDPEFGLNKVRTFLEQVFPDQPDASDDAKVEAFAEKAFGPNSPCVGRYVKVYSSVTVTKRNKKHICVQKFEYLDEDALQALVDQAQVDKAKG